MGSARPRPSPVLYLGCPATNKQPYSLPLPGRVLGVHTAHKQSSKKHPCINLCGCVQRLLGRPLGDDSEATTLEELKDIGSQWRSGILAAYEQGAVITALEAADPASDIALVQAAVTASEK